MKKFIYITLLVLVASVKGFANDNKKVVDAESEASYFALNNFSSRFSAAENVNWTITDAFQKASFILNGEKLAAFFDLNGEYIATTQHVDFNKLPALSKARLAKLYKGYEVDDVVKYDLDGQSANFDMLTGRRNYDSMYFASIKNKKETILIKITPDGEIAYMKNI